MNPLSTHAKSLTQNLQTVQRTNPGSTTLATPDKGSTVSSGQKDGYFPSPPGFGKGPSLVEKLFKKIGQAHKWAKNQPISVGPAFPGARPQTTSKPVLANGGGLERPWGTGEFLGKELPQMGGKIDTTPLGARDNPYLQSGKPAFPGVTPELLTSPGSLMQRPFGTGEFLGKDIPKMGGTLDLGQPISRELLDRGRLM